MRTAAPIVLTALICAVALTGCASNNGGTAGADGNTTSPGSASATATPTESIATSEASSQSSASASSSASAKPSTQSSSKLVLTLGGKQQDITPTDVYCSGKPGRIRHIIGKTNQRPPLVEANGKRFVLVKVGSGKPFKAQSPTGVSYTKTAVTFTDVDLRGATLSGTMTCTVFED